MKRFQTLTHLLQAFPNEQAALAHLKAVRFKDGLYCPHCGCRKVFTFSNGLHYKCAECRKKFTAKVGTIFEDSKVPLQKWFLAIYLITAHKKGISSLQLSKDVGVTQKTAWFMLHRLRHASKTKAFNAPLKNIVEVDETYVGGKERNKHASKRVEGTQGRSTVTKTPVMAVVERQGRVRATVTPHVNAQSVGSFVTDNVVLGSTVMSDDYRGYSAIKWLFAHDTVNHSAGQYVKGRCHTNTVEGFFSLLKRGIVGIYHNVTPKHLLRYVDEFAFRYNSKAYTEEARFNLLLTSCDAKRLSYANLIAAHA